MIFELWIRATLLVGVISKSLNLGNGKTLPGKLILKLYPNAIEKLSKNKQIFCVSGTNGKTSTTRFLANAIAGTQLVVSNETGSNLPQGIVVALVEAHLKNISIVVLEVDELHLANRAQELNPAGILLLNLSRDQLDRMHEVGRVANQWAKSFSKLSNTIVIGNLDDPYISYVLDSVPQKIAISFGGRLHIDGAVCPKCSNYLNWEGNNYSCVCGLSNQSSVFYSSKNSSEINYYLVKTLLSEFKFKIPEFDTKQLERRKQIEIRGRILNARLAKNPESWSEALAGVKSNQIILILNSRLVDGFDISWIWDISFEKLKGRNIVITGDRAVDLSFRLHIEGIESEMKTNLKEAVEVFPINSEIEVLAVYTAFQDLVGSK